VLLLTCPEGFLSDLDVEGRWTCATGSALYGKNWTIECMARAQLSPKRLLMRYKFDTRGSRHAEDVLTHHHAGLASPATWLELSRHSPSPNLQQMVLNSVTCTELLISVDGLLTKTTIGKFTDDYMERTKGTTDWKSTLTTHTSHGSRIVTSRSADRRGRKAHWTQVEACTPPGRQRGWFQHGVQGESTEWCRDHCAPKVYSSASTTRS
jgi:hypothetical protein